MKLRKTFRVTEEKEYKDFVNYFGNGNFEDAIQIAKKCSEIENAYLNLLKAFKKEMKKINL